MKLHALAGALAALCLSACGTSVPAAASVADNPVTRAIPAVGTAPVIASTLDEKGWIAATNTWGSTVYAYNAARKAGKLTPAQVALGRKVVAEGRAIRLAGDAALDAANATNLGAQIGALGRVVTSLNTLRQ